MSVLFNLQPYGIKRPEKVKWRFPRITTDLLNHIPSKSLRSFLATTDQVLTENNITLQQKKLERNDFLEWLTYYQQKMSENNYRILADPAWFDQRVDQGKIIEGIFCYQQGQLVGSGVFVKQPQKKATFAFKATDRLNLSNKPNSSLGAVVDYLFLRYMVEEKMPIISAGQSRNAFGVFNTVGYLDYKLRFGYLPSASKKAVLTDSVPLNEQGVVLFVGYKQEQPYLFGVYPANKSVAFEQARFSSQQLPFEQIAYKV